MLKSVSSIVFGDVSWFRLWSGWWSVRFGSLGGSSGGIT